MSPPVDSLPVHGVHHLDVHLQLVQGEQHPLAAVGTATQVDQVDLRSRKGGLVRSARHGVTLGRIGTTLGVLCPDSVSLCR